jgi:hypothetical protein
MTQEDLEQIRAIVSSALIANNPVLLSAMRAMQDHIDGSIAELRDDVSKRLDQIERSLDQWDSRFTAFEFQMAEIVSQSPRIRSSMAN